MKCTDNIAIEIQDVVCTYHETTCILKPPIVLAYGSMFVTMRERGLFNTVYTTSVRREYVAVIIILVKIAS